MKNLFFLGFLALIVATSCKTDCLEECRSALTTFSEVENTSFEEWTSSENSTYEELDPVGQWVSLNPISNKPADVKRAPITVFKTTGSDSAYVGNGVRITTGVFAPLAGVGPLATEGILAIGQLKKNGNDLANPISYGHHFTRKMKSIKGFYKYLPEKNDSALIVFRGFNYLSCSCNEQILFEETFKLSETSDWAPFGINISEPYEGIPDGVAIIFSSSGLPTDLKGIEGSTLFIDELEVEYY